MNKKTVAILFLCCVVNSIFAQKLSIKNIFGGDFDSLGDYDLFSQTTETDVNGTDISKTRFALGDRFQVELDSKMIDAKVRLEMLYQNNDETVPTFLFIPTGFIQFEPIKQLGIAVGNSFYQTFAIPSAYLAAADDTTKHGRLLTDSLGEDLLFGTNDFSVYSNGFSGGITSFWKWGTFDEYYFKLAGGTTFCYVSDEWKNAVDFGINLGIENIFDIGCTAQNVLDNDKKLGAFIGCTAVQNAVMNAAFYYNFTDSEYLPEARVNRGGVDEFKKQTTKYAVGLSVGYDFKNVGFSIFADFITGLTNEYIGKIKYYDDDDNLIKTETTTIIRDQTVVKYEENTPKRTDEFVHEAIPLYGQIKMTYAFSDNVEAALNIKCRTLLNAFASSWITVYPRVNVELPQKIGDIALGVRLDCNLSRYKGVSSFSVPVTYTYKFKKKF